MPNGPDLVLPIGQGSYRFVDEGGGGCFEIHGIQVVLDGGFPARDSGEVVGFRDLGSYLLLMVILTLSEFES